MIKFSFIICILTFSRFGDAISSKSITNQLQNTVRSGRVYQQDNFLSEDEITTLLDHIHTLDKEGKMQSSGLSNTAKKDQGFGKADRTVCPVPWWLDSLQGKRIVNDEKMNKISEKIQQLRMQLSDQLGRESMKDSNLAHECYYSQSRAGASLARHMDEFHEETKGTRGWLLPSRRSISWLIYLSDENWSESNGGQLRSFPQQNFLASRKVEVGSYDGDLQVGWLDLTSNSTLPVFLNSWYKSEDTKNLPGNCILYTIINGEKTPITLPWSSEMVGSFYDFIKMQRERKDESSLFLTPEYSQKFKLIQDREQWSDGSPPPGSIVEDIIPRRGSIVMFDSVTLPHEVLPVISGTRTALAGWFHEMTQPIPDNFF
jgi:Rps23 Pro-64 3,4-dihydroxylase Tpa1-like proline 4-hydroxylase